MYWHDGDHMSGRGVTLMTISTVGFWVLVIVGIVLLVRYLGRADRPGPGPTPERLLAERFARGEIDEEADDDHDAHSRGRRTGAAHGS
jgi:putative membrane protein